MTLISFPVNEFVTLRLHSMINSIIQVDFEKSNLVFVDLNTIFFQHCDQMWRMLNSTFRFWIRCNVTLNHIWMLKIISGMNVLHFQMGHWRVATRNRNRKYLTGSRLLSERNCQPELTKMYSATESFFVGWSTKSRRDPSTKFKLAAAVSNWWRTFRGT